MLRKAILSRMKWLCLVVAACAYGVTPAFAQSAYVAAGVGMDVSRFGGVDAPNGGGFQPDGEAVAFSLRTGTRIGQNWGVELGFTRPSEIESEQSFGPVPLAAASNASLTRVGGPGAVGVASTIFPAFESRQRMERRDTTLDVAAWVAQSIGNRLDLVYLGGVAFNRTTEEISYEFSPRLGSIIFPTPNSIRSTSYGVSPVAGFDARVALTDHVRLVPGIRLQGIGGGVTGTGGWLVRPSVGLMWQF